MATKANKDVDKQLKQIGERLRALRKKKYNNYEHFAYEHDISRVQYGRYEQGKDFRMSSFLKILNALDVTLEDFFDKDWGK